MECEFIQNLTTYCFILDKTEMIGSQPKWPYSYIVMYSDGSGHIEYRGEIKFSFEAKQYWEQSNKILVEEMGKLK